MEKVTRLVVQQPQFLPWAGQFFKLAACDVYVFYAGVKFDQSDHQHRVTIDGQWMTLPVESHSRSKLIKDVKLVDLPRHLVKIEKTLRQKVLTRRTPYADRLEPLLRMMRNWSSEYLLDFVTSTTGAVCEILGVNPEFRFDLNSREHVDEMVHESNDARKIAKLQACIDDHFPEGGVMYMAGGGGLSYMNHDSLSGPVVETRFQRMRPGVSPDSFLQSIADHPDPMALVRECAVWVDKHGVEYGLRE